MIVYSIKNKITNKYYVGCTADFSKRKHRHRINAEKHSYSSQSKLYPAINKYGWNNFVFEILENCSSEASAEREEYWIKKLNAFTDGYNTTCHGRYGTGQYWSGKKRPDVSASRKNTQSILKAIEATRIKVICLDDNKTFNSITEASKTIGRTDSALAYALRNGKKCAKKRWDYVK